MYAVKAAYAGKEHLIPDILIYYTYYRCFWSNLSHQQYQQIISLFQIKQSSHKKYFGNMYCIGQQCEYLRRSFTVLVSKNRFFFLLFWKYASQNGFREKQVPSLFWSQNMSICGLFERLVTYDRSAHQVVPGWGPKDFRKFSTWQNSRRSLIVKLMKPM